MIFEMAGARVENGLGHAGLVEAIYAETIVGTLIIASEVEVMLDERRTRIGVIADTIAAHPGIEDGQGEKKNDKQIALKSLRIVKLSHQLRAIGRAAECDEALEFLKM
jgi:hypothetical protein